MNVDYSICQTLSQLHPLIPSAAVIYDVCCIWSIHFQERVAKSEHLSLPPNLALVYAIGKFHLGAHVRECFAEYSLNFLQGAGQVDGEILETLWAGLDLIAGCCRSMTRAHRQEVYDDYMFDSNLKKMISGRMFYTFR
jgi:Kyakuja-Dileera-Zisupton transposase